MEARQPASPKGEAEPCKAAARTAPMTLNPDIRSTAVGRPAPIHLLDGPDYEHIEKGSRQHYASSHREGPEELAGALNH
jgi:hypothetical protein